MSVFDLDKSLESAQARLGKDVPKARKRRSDAGGTRLAAPVASELCRLLGGTDRPAIREVERQLRAFCKERNLRSPARATVYRFMTEIPVHEYRVADLPDAVRAALYNLDPRSRVPGHQLVFYAFNYGDARAMSFASALPWLDLYQAARMRGWRPMSLGPLCAAIRQRGIE